MALAPYIAKAISSVHSLVAGYSADKVAERLNETRICVAFDDTAAASPEGRLLLTLLIDLLARLYPDLDLAPLSHTSETLAFADELARIAKVVNPTIDVFTVDRDVLTTLVVGHTVPSSEKSGRILYLGSTGWIAIVSEKHPIPIGTSEVPFGAYAAACLGAANVFRQVFSDGLTNRELDSDLALSLYDYSIGTTASANTLSNPDLPVELQVDHFLVGVGAIGHGCCFCLSKVPGLKGTLNLIDDEDYDDSNPQRYAGSDANSAGKKVDTVAKWFAAPGGIRAVPNCVTWDEFVSNRESKNYNSVAVALDSAEDRIFVQSTLPKRIVNSWTQSDNVGVSRHGFLKSACLACLYLPNVEVQSVDEEVVAALKFPADHLRLVREILDTHCALSSEMVRQIELQVGISSGSLQEFEGKQLLTLYQRAACGGLILQLGGQLGATTERVQVPLVFQSAFAGLLLAVEIVVDAGELRETPFPVRTEFDLLRPISGTPSSPEGKHPSGRCICQDPDFIFAYTTKYQAT